MSDFATELYREHLEEASFLSEGDQKLIPVVGKLIGYRRLSSGKELLAALQQKQAIAKYSEWIKANGGRFQEGQWYFAGKLMTSP